MHIPRLSRAVLLPALLASTVLLRAAEKNDLERIEPVPADQPIPVIDFVRLPLMNQPVTNLSGTLIAACVPSVEDRHAVIIYSPTTKKLQTVSGAEESFVGDPIWLTDDRLIFPGGSYLFGAETQGVARSYPILERLNNRIISVPESNRDHPWVWIPWDRTGRPRGAYTITTAMAAVGPESELEQRNEVRWVNSLPVPEGGLATRYIADKLGEVAFVIVAKDGYETLLRVENGKWVKCPVNLDEIDVKDAGNKPGELVVLGPRVPGKTRPLQFMDATTGKLGDVLLDDPGYDFNGWFYRDPQTHDIIGLNYQRNGPHVEWLRGQEAEEQRALNASFPKGEIVQIVSRSRVGHKFVTSRFSDVQPAIYDWVDFDAKSAGLIKASRPWIDPKRMRHQQILQFKTRDGKVLDAYLTLPKGASLTSPAPVVVMPPSDFAQRWGWGYEDVVQFLANRGWAVLQANDRGSAGYSGKFPLADRFDLAKIHDDITDATRAAIATKYIDPKRVAIMGSSLGGYLAIYGVTDEPGLYCCAVSVDGIYDWGVAMREAKYFQYDTAQFGWMKRYIGDAATQNDKFEIISPLRRANKITVPVFVSYGMYKQYQNSAQAHELLSALDRNHIPNDSYFVGDDWRRGMYRLDDRLELMKRVEAFLSKYLAPARPEVGVPAPAK